MAINLVKKTEASKILEIISKDDSSIDWTSSFCNRSDLTVEEKKRLYGENHNTKDLRFLDSEDKPTIFVFKHPSRADIRKKVRTLYAMAFDSAKKKISESVDVQSEFYELAFIGTKTGLDGTIAEAPRVNGQITEDYFQALEDSGVFGEVCLTFIHEAGKDREGTDNQKK